MSYKLILLPPYRLPGLASPKRLRDRVPPKLQRWRKTSRLILFETASYIYIMNKVNLSEKFNLFTEHWSPKIVGELNGQQVKLVKFKGPFVWHHHETEDELFYVVKGSFDMEFRDRTVTINEGEFLIVPKGVEHRPNASAEVQVLLFEPATTLNTGNTENEKTVKNLQHL